MNNVALKRDWKIDSLVSNHIICVHLMGKDNEQQGRMLFSVACIEHKTFKVKTDCKKTCFNTL